MELNAAEIASKSKGPEAVAIVQWLLILGGLYHLPYMNAALVAVYAILASLGCLLVVLLCFVPRAPIPMRALRSKVFHLSTLLQLLVFSTAGNTTLVILLLAIEAIGVVVVWQMGE